MSKSRGGERLWGDDPTWRYNERYCADGSATMKYLCLAYEEEAELNALSRSEWHALREETLAYVEHLRAGGHLIATHPLQSARTAATVRVRNGRTAVTDGPFAETKEQLGGYFLVEARDLNEAIQLASKWPSARLGTIEVRPVETELKESGRYEATADAGDAPAP